MAVASSLTRYRPLRRIASGGMATISLAEDTVLGRPVALKRLHGTASRTGVSRLRREALLGASVSHPNLVSVYDVVTENDDVVIVMEYVDGRTLKDALAQEGRLPPREALRILRGVADALDAIHAHGIVHRDVKPPNILLGQGGEVKLADLGIATAADHTSITTEGSVLGSFSYMAPEQLQAATATPAMDIYALAAVAFEALSGRRARQENNPLALAHAIATQPPPDLRDAWPQAPAAVAELLKRGMAREPGARPGSAGELLRDLVTAMEPELGAGSRRRRAVGPGAVGAGAVGAGAVGAGAAAGLATEVTQPAGRPPGSPGASARRSEHSSRRRSGWLAPLLLGLVALAVLAAVLSSGGGAHRTAARGSTSTQAAAKAKTKSRRVTRHTSHSTTGTGSAQAAPTGPGGNATPVSAVERFYELAAAHQFSSAWALADPAFRNQLQGYDSFVAGQEGDRRIIFDSARVINQSPGSATVAISTTSIRDDGTEACAGTVALVPGGGGWLLDHIDINCRPAYAQSHPGPGPAKQPGPPGKHPGPGQGHGPHGKHS